MVSRSLSRVHQLNNVLHEHVGKRESGTSGSPWLPSARSRFV